MRRGIGIGLQFRHSAISSGPPPSIPTTDFSNPDNSGYFPVFFF